MAYQHKIYQFEIPLKELGVENPAQASDLLLVFSAYGSASPRKTSVAACAAIQADGTLWAWGENEAGQLVVTIAITRLITGPSTDAFAWTRTLTAPSLAYQKMQDAIGDALPGQTVPVPMVGNQGLGYGLNELEKMREDG